LVQTGTAHIGQSPPPTASVASRDRPWSKTRRLPVIIRFITGCFGVADWARAGQADLFVFRFACDKGKRCGGGTLRQAVAP